MQNDLRQQYDQAMEESHHGRPTIVESVQSGSRGRPSIVIDPGFLQWAYSLQSTSSIARFLGVSWRLVWQQLLEHGIAEPQEQPFMLSVEYSTGTDGGDILDPDGTVDSVLQPIQDTVITSYTGPLSQISDGELDTLLIRLWRHFRRAGVTMLDGMLRQLGYRISREHICQSLMRIDPVQHVFQRIQIRCHVYSVPGPNSLWHHDGQHGE
jgi:hypothetical protein